jgi:hypothetical protein
MGVQNINDAKILFMQAWNDNSRRVQKVSESDQQRAREAFYKAVRDCDKATEKIMDEHLERVAESAKKLAEYHRKKAITDRAMKEADIRREINEAVLIDRINHHNMLEDLRVRELNRKALAEADGRG